MENTHGYYDAILGVNLLNASYRPMNVKYTTWKSLADQLGFNEWQVFIITLAEKPFLIMGHG